MMKNKRLTTTLLGLAVSISMTANAQVYITQDEFLAQRFENVKSDQKPIVKTLWLDQSLQDSLTSILGHPYPKLRLRYWKLDNQTVWFLDEIGKERPITFGVSVIDNRIDKIEVIEFRESRGYEIHMETFSRQFDDLILTEDNDLNGHIDGITGATMSVSAMKKIARVGLLLHKLVSEES